MNELKQKIKNYIEERGWSILQNPGAIAKSISIESAELLEIFQWKDYSSDEIKNDPMMQEKIKSELADVLIYATEMAIALDLDIELIMNEKLDKNAEKYPAELVKGNQEEYLKIKQNHRDNRA